MQHEQPAHKLEWRHAVGNEPAFLMDDGRMIGQWYPGDGMLTLYIGQAPNEQAAMSVLELLATSEDAAESLDAIQFQVFQLVMGNDSDVTK